MAKFIIKTLGCKVNQCESSSLYNQLAEKGYEPIKEGKADICIINTCTVTSTSDKKSLRVIRKLVRENQDSFVVVMGCVVDFDYDNVISLEGVDVAVRNKEKDKTASIICEHVSLDDDSTSFPLKEDDARTRKFIKIQDGCESFCSYCIIPYVRGAETSRDMDTILAEVKEAADRGFQEIVLTGIHLGRFNKGKQPTLPDLIEAITEVSGILRVRLSSIEINEVTDELLHLIDRSDKVCASLHIPLQHGSSRILKLMERPYDAEAFCRRIEEIRAALGGKVSFSTDIIIGFPGETEEDINNMIDVLKAVAFHRVHVFPFSPREGTKAFAFDDKVSPVVVKKRLAKINAVTDCLQKEHYSSLVGQKRKVLLELKDSSGFYCGYSSFYERIKIKDSKNELKKNTFVEVSIKKEYDDFCIGVLIK